MSGLEIATNTVANATNISSSATKASGLVAKMATRFSVLMKNNGHFLKHFVLLIHKMGLQTFSLKRKTFKIRKEVMLQSILCLAVKDSLTTSKWLAMLPIAS